MSQVFFPRGGLRLRKLAERRHPPGHSSRAVDGLLAEAAAPAEAIDDQKDEDCQQAAADQHLDNQIAADVGIEYRGRQDDRQHHQHRNDGTGEQVEPAGAVAASLLLASAPAMQPALRLFFICYLQAVRRTAYLGCPSLSGIATPSVILRTSLL